MSDEQRHDHFQSLLRQVQAGSDEAARQLYETYVKHVLRVVRHRMWHRLRSQYDSADFVQQVWASFFDVRHTLPDFQTPEDLVNYLLAMARNKVAMAGRARQAAKRDIDLEIRIEEESLLAGPRAARDPTPSSVAIAGEQYDRLVTQQPLNVREVAELRIEGRTFDEIAEELAIDESTARRKIQQLKDEG